MAKPRPKGLLKDRAIAAFKKAHPAYTNDITVHKRRSEQVVRVRGKDNHGIEVLGVWSYANNGSLERVN